MNNGIAGRRAVLRERIVDIVLADGLSAFALRGLASRLGTSGRMLLYYFGDKDTLVRDVLRAASARMAGLLASTAGEAGARPDNDAGDNATSSQPTSPGRLVYELLRLADQREITPFMRLWTEVVAAGARGEAPFDDVAPAVVASWVALIEDRLLPVHRGTGVAVAILAVMDGITLLELASPGTTGAARALLPGLLDGHGGDSHSAAPTASTTPRCP